MAVLAVERTSAFSALADAARTRLSACEIVRVATVVIVALRDRVGDLAIELIVEAELLIVRNKV